MKEETILFRLVIISTLKNFYDFGQEETILFRLVIISTLKNFYDFGHEKGDVRDHVTTRLLPTRGLSVRGPHHSRLASFFSRVCSRNQRFLLRLIIFRIFPYFSLSKKSLLHRFTNGKCEEFFRYIYDKMRDAEAEIRATITVQTTESTVAKKSDKDVSHAKTADGRRNTMFGGRRDTLIAGQRQNIKS